jgi:1-acyl-sn-glycerol-3-phosphate acyltransferase
VERIAAAGTPIVKAHGVGDSVPRRGNALTRATGRTLLRLFGWRIEGELPNLSKYVAITAPHTSNWDFFFGICAIFELGIRVDWVGKHTLFRRPWGSLMRFLGGTPIVRTETEGAVGQIVEAMSSRDSFILGLSPEGTRKRVDRWKTGFYHIARQAGVPILQTYFDYKRKIVGIGPMFRPTGHIERDLSEIRAFYFGKTGRYPAQF